MLVLMLMANLHGVRMSHKRCEALIDTMISIKVSEMNQRNYKGDEQPSAFLRNVRIWRLSCIKHQN